MILRRPFFFLLVDSFWFLSEPSWLAVCEPSVLAASEPWAGVGPAASALASVGCPLAGGFAPLAAEPGVSGGFAAGVVASGLASLVPVLGFELLLSAAGWLPSLLPVVV